MWNRSRILANLASNPRNVAKGIYRLFLLQTYDEQAARTTKHRNHRGFAKHTVYQGTRIGRLVAEAIRPYGYDSTLVDWGNILSPNDLITARRICEYHVRQLVAMVRVRQQQKRLAA